MFSKRDVGIEIHFIKWSRSSRNTDSVVESGILNKVGRVNICIGNDTYKIKGENDFCLLASSGDLSDSSIEIYRNKDDVEKQKLASTVRRSLIAICSDRQKLESLPLSKVEQILRIFNQ